MVQAMLTERFALKIHKEQREMSGFELTVAGDRSKMKPSAAADENPGNSRRVGDALVSDGITTATFAKLLGAYLSKPVADKTGLTGLFDARVAWNERADQVPDANPDSPATVSLISALRDQLGMRLVAKRVTADVFVVDGAEKATPN
jgi:uncharacterized protein (TIGR03435 family)